MLVLSHIGRLAKSRNAFLVTSFVSASLLASFIFWMTIDAQYRTTIDMFPYHLGLKSGTQLGLGDGDLLQKTLSYERRFHRQGSRFLLMFVLASAVLSSSFLIIGHYLHRPTRRRLLVVGVLVMCWCLFLIFHEKLDERLLLLRSRALVPQCKLAAETLSDKWPTENGTLAGAGNFRVGQERISNYIFLEVKPPYQRQERLGYSIERSNTTNIHFGLMARSDWQIEYHPDNSLPSSYQSGWGHTFQLTKSFQIEGQWYLAKYERVSKSI